jgi:hypothetical protein
VGLQIGDDPALGPIPDGIDDPSSPHFHAGLYGRRSGQAALLWNIQEGSAAQLLAKDVGVLREYGSRAKGKQEQHEQFFHFFPTVSPTLTPRTLKLVRKFNSEGSCWQAFPNIFSQRSFERFVKRKGELGSRPQLQMNRPQICIRGLKL